MHSWTVSIRAGDPGCCRTNVSSSRQSAAKATRPRTRDDAPIRNAIWIRSRTRGVPSRARSGGLDEILLFMEDRCTHSRPVSFTFQGIPGAWVITAGGGGSRWRGGYGTFRAPPSHEPPPDRWRTRLLSRSGHALYPQLMVQRYGRRGRTTRMGLSSRRPSGRGGRTVPVLRDRVWDTVRQWRERRVSTICADCVNGRVGTPLSVRSDQWDCPVDPRHRYAMESAHGGSLLSTGAAKVLPAWERLEAARADAVTEAVAVARTQLEDAVTQVEIPWRFGGRSWRAMVEEVAVAYTSCEQLRARECVPGFSRRLKAVFPPVAWVGTRRGPTAGNADRAVL